MSLQLRSVSASFGMTTILHSLDLELSLGECMVILGSSGSGKSTLLRVLMGIQKPSGGEIILDACRIDQLPPDKRDVAMMFQHHALFPHLDVLNNLKFGLRMKKVPLKEQFQRIDEIVEMCHIGAFLDRKPHQLSGGQQQRIAMARALVMRPSLLLLDEPFSSLDSGLRIQLREEVRQLQRNLRMTCLYVTHDQDDAMILADRVAILERGRLIETGTPEQMYVTPRTAFTASFLGQAKLFHIDVNKDDASIGILPWGAFIKLNQTAKTSRVTVMLRPENLMLYADQSGEGIIEERQYRGQITSYIVSAAGERWQADMLNANDKLGIGTRVRLNVNQSFIHVLQDEFHAT